MPMRSKARSRAGIRSIVQSLAYDVIHLSSSSRCSPTPATTSAANAVGSTGSPASTAAGGRFLLSASYNRDRARSRAWRRLPPRSVTSHPGQVLAAARVDLDLVARVDEQGDLHDEAGLQGGRLAGAGHPVALDAGLGLGHVQLDRRRHVDA